MRIIAGGFFYSLTSCLFCDTKHYMLRIRFLRVGKKNSPSFRVVVTPRRSATKTGRFLEILGSYNPVRHEKGLKAERIQYWLSQGAQPSDRVRNMLISEGIMEGEKVAVHKKAKAKPESAEAKKEGADTEAPAEPAKTKAE